MFGSGKSTRTVHSELPSSWLEPSVHSAYLHVSAKLMPAHPRPVIGPPRLLPITEFLSLLEAYQAVDRPETGIDLGLAIPVATHGSMGLSALSSDTLWDAMATMVRYAPVRNAMFEYRCFQQNEAAVLQLRPRLQLGEFAKFFAYATVLACYNILKAISEDAASDGIRITFPWEMPAWPHGSAISADAFDFEQEFPGVRLPLEVAMRPSRSADPDLCERLKKVGEDELAGSVGSTAARVRYLLRQKAPVWLSLQEVADRLAMSKRTLIRKLERDELSYQLLLDEARIELACWFLRRSDMQLSEIAEQIGFSDQAGFTRSFRRVQGCTPTQCRSDFRRASDPA